MTAAAVQVFSIGFTEKSAERFFTLIEGAGVRRVVDVRLHNDSQLAGFSKRKDLEFFLRRMLGIQYVHIPELAPTKEMLDGYKKGGGSWADYEKRFLDLMAARRIEDNVDPDLLRGGCLLCSEHKPHKCHRRLVAEYLAGKWDAVTIQHLT